MANVRYEQRWCPADERLVRAEQPKPNHVLHLILSLVTVGLWLPVWLLVAIACNWSAYRCPSCGSATESKIWHEVKSDSREVWQKTKAAWDEAKRAQKAKDEANPPAGFWQQVRDERAKQRAKRQARAEARATAKQERAAARRAKQARW